MPETMFKYAVAVALLSFISGTIGAMPDDSGPAGTSEQEAGEKADTLPGRIMDPTIVLPPGDRTAYSGAPADWENFIPDSEVYTFTIFDRLEYGTSGEGESYLWDIQGWIGGDYNKFWWKTEGEGPTSGDPEKAEFQALYNRTIAPFWGVQVGLRHDTRPGPGPDRTYAVFGLQGLAPYWFETDTSLYVSEETDLSFRGEVEYDFLLTQRLILQPRLGFNLSASDTPELGLASGLNNTEAGLRLRYEIVRQFAPYIGVRWNQLYGDTRDLAEDADEPTSETSLVAGFRIWF
ncbi:copper resistance protein B [Marinobacter sp.]|uniref:copper resistance protein B n=1 Tax=Marinobacter sp. TaxID=50741 RepID=UPI00384B1A43